MKVKSLVVKSIIAASLAAVAVCGFAACKSAPVFNNNGVLQMDQEQITNRLQQALKDNAGAVGSLILGESDETDGVTIIPVYQKIGNPLGLYAGKNTGSGELKAIGRYIIVAGQSETMYFVREVADPTNLSDEDRTVIADELLAKVAAKLPASISVDDAAKAMGKDPRKIEQIEQIFDEYAPAVVYKTPLSYRLPSSISSRNLSNIVLSNYDTNDAIDIFSKIVAYSQGTKQEDVILETALEIGADDTIKGVAQMILSINWEQGNAGAIDAATQLVMGEVDSIELNGMTYALFEAVDGVAIYSATPTGN